MEIRYKRTYSPARGKRYTVGEIPTLLGFAMELADPRVKLKEGKLAPGGICMMIFGITPDEYALRESDPRQLDALADRILKNVPSDRLLGWRIVDLKGAAVNRVVQLQTGESIDDGTFARLIREKIASVQSGPLDALLMESKRLQGLCADKNVSDETKQEWAAAREKLGKALLGLEKIWVADDGLMNRNWPALGFDGRIEVFTTLQRAQNAAKQIAKAHADLEVWKIREIPAGEIQGFFGHCAGDGFAAVRVDNGFAAAELMLKDFCSEITENNAVLRGNLIREMQYGLRWQRMKEAGAEEAKLRGALESTLTLRNFAWRELGNARLFALCIGGKRENCVLLNRREGGERMLAVFSCRLRANAFAEQVEGDARPVEMSFDELALHAKPCGGMLVDVGMIGYLLQQANYDQVRQLREKPPMVVRIQPQPAAPAKPQAAEGLPNPDEFMPAAPAQATKEAVPAQAESAQPSSGEAPAQAEPPKPEKKGFFKKLFGK